MIAFPNQGRGDYCVKLALVVAVAAVMLLPGLGSFGFWDPAELDVLDRARAGHTPALWSVRVGLGAIGVSELGARLPLALMGIATAVLTFVWVAHAARPRVGLYAALLVTASPLFILQSRQLTSSVDLMLGHTAVIAGAALWLTATRRLHHIVGPVLALAGGALAYVAGGALAGLVIPLAAVAVAAFATRRIVAGSAVATAVAVICVATAAGWLALGGHWRAKTPPLVWSAGAEQLAFGAFPWLALVPVAVSRYRYRLSVNGWLACAWATLTFAGGTMLEHKLGPIRFPALPALALPVAVWLDSVHRRTPASAGALVFVALVALVLGRNLVEFPDRLASLHLGGHTISHGDAVGWLRWVPLVVALAFAGLFAAAPRLGWRRACGVGSVGVCLVFGGLIAAAWTPRWSQTQSIRTLFDRYHAPREPGQPLAVASVSARSVAFYAPEARHESQTAIVRALTATPRTFAIVPASMLCAVSQRARAAQARLTVVAQSRSFVLVSNRHRAGEPRATGLDDVIGSGPVSPARRVTANFADTLELLGADLPARVGRGNSFTMTLYFKVLRRPRRRWRVFVHFDRPGTRFQGDHWPIANRCPAPEWNPGDIIIDRFRVTAGNITYPTGSYQVRMGLFVGKHGKYTNMRVVAGPADRDHRVDLGRVQLR